MLPYPWFCADSLHDENVNRTNDDMYCSYRIAGEDPCLSFLLSLLPYFAIIPSLFFVVFWPSLEYSLFLKYSHLLCIEQKERSTLLFSAAAV